MPEALTVLKHGIGYDLVVHRTGVESKGAGRGRGERLVLGIRCHACGRVSYHPKDIDERYCGACHQFHSDRNPNEA